MAFTFLTMGGFVYWDAFGAVCFVTALTSDEAGPARMPFLMAEWIDETTAGQESEA